LRALFLPPASAISPQASALLLQLPAELLSVVLSRLDTRHLAFLAITCRLLWRDAPAPPPPPQRVSGPVETELRRRAAARGLAVGASLPEEATSWMSYLLKREFYDTLRRQAPVAAGAVCDQAPMILHSAHSIFVDRKGCLYTCGRGHRLGHDRESGCIEKPTPVPSMLDRRIISVASGGEYCLALSAEGEVYSWGDGEYGSLGHGDVDARAVPSRITSLSRIEQIAAGYAYTSAAVDEKGNLYTWGIAFTLVAEDEPAGISGLGYRVSPGTECQPTPKRVDALSQERVVGVALAGGLTLAVTDAGAVFSFGNGISGMLGHGSDESEVLPRRIEALAETGRWFVAVAAGCGALALTEEGQVYGWGWGGANGHGREECTPQLVAALVEERVKLLFAGYVSSCAVRKTGELFTWAALLIRFVAVATSATVSIRHSPRRCGWKDWEARRSGLRQWPWVPATRLLPMRMAWCGPLASAMPSASPTLRDAKM